MKFLFRGDDLGYSEAINYGIEKCVKAGLLMNAGLMPNRPAASHGVNLLKGTKACLWQHTNICLGHPCADPKKIPSLLNENGKFYGSRVYREAWKEGKEFTVLEEMVTEVEAQYQRFVELTGCKPALIDAHGVRNHNLTQAIKITAQKHGVKYFFDGEATVGTDGGKDIYNCPMYSMRPGEYDPLQCLKDAVADAKADRIHVFICHPGYLDAEVFRCSSLTVNRTKEVEMLCDPAVKKWVEQQGIQLTTYNDI